MAFLADLRTYLLTQATITDSVGATGVYEGLADGIAPALQGELACRG